MFCLNLLEGQTADHFVSMVRLSEDNRKKPSTIQKLRINMFLGYCEFWELFEYSVYSLHCIVTMIPFSSHSQNCHFFQQEILVTVNLHLRLFLGWGHHPNIYLP